MKRIVSHHEQSSQELLLGALLLSLCKSRTTLMDCLRVCGSSEMKWLTLNERIELARRAISRAGHLPVLATANLGLDLSKHRDEVSKMTDTGVLGAVLVLPPGPASEPDRLEAYFGDLIRAIRRVVLTW